MRPEKSKQTIGYLAADRRLEEARKKTDQLVSALCAHFQTHANNRIIFYSDTLAGQIPRSYAAKSFKTFQYDLLHYELFRLCRFWDKIDFDGYSIPTVIALVDNPDVKRLVCDDHFRLHKLSGDNFALDAARKSRRWLNDAIRNSNTIEDSEILRHSRNFRHKLAHLLEQTNQEKDSPVAPPRFGDENVLLRKSQTVINQLHLSLNGAGFDWSGSRKMSKRNAEYLWNGVKINVAG